MSFRARLDDCASWIGAALEARLLAYPGDSDVTRAMAYATDGGKRLRGFLVMEGARLHGIEDAVSADIGAVIEAIHAYSLVHDDLPCMDDDDLRRGRPTVHRQWDEATAVLAGDALQTFAFSLLASATLEPLRIVHLTGTLAEAAGARGMVLGQALDIAAETAETPLTLAEVEALQAEKTGALIEWSAAAGARMADADDTALLAYGRALGRAFQIADDILDETGNEATAGKRLHKDADAGKATFVSLLGLDGARARARDLVAEAEAALEPYGKDAHILQAAARFVIDRDA